MAETTNYGLYIEDDDSVLFKDWRERMNGVQNSNMVKIDAILKEISGAGVIDIETEESSESGGLNKITFTLATGDVIDFTIRNGNDSVSITNAYINDDNELMLELSEGQPINLGVVVGADGYTPVKGKDYFDGDNGVGIASATINNNGELVLTYSNGNTANLGVIEGEDGYTPIKGVDYDDGVGIKDIVQTTTGSGNGGSNIITVTLTDDTTKTFTVKNGTKGNNGTSCTHSWNGTKLTITSASGTSSADLKGATGNGIASLKQTTTSSISGEYNKWTATMTDGSTSVFQVRNGGDGIGVSDMGYNTETGKWYWTDDFLSLEHEFTGPTIPSKASDVNAYSKDEVDAMFGNYITELAALVGGDA